VFQSSAAPGRIRKQSRRSANLVSGGNQQKQALSPRLTALIPYVCLVHQILLTLPRRFGPGCRGCAVEWRAGRLVPGDRRQSMRQVLGILESLRPSGSFREFCFLSWPGSCASPSTAQYGIHTPTRGCRNNSLDSARDYGGDLPGDGLSRLPATAVYGPDQERAASMLPFCRGIRRGSRIQGLPDGDSDRPVGGHVGNLAIGAERSPGMIEPRRMPRQKGACWRARSWSGP